MNGRTARAGGAALWLGLSVLVAGPPAKAASPALGRSRDSGPAAAAPSSTRDSGLTTTALPAPHCFGAHDLNLSGNTLILSGTQTYDRVCLTAGATLQVPDGITLRTGLLFVDHGSAISSSPLPHDSSDPCETGTGPAGAITLVARTAIISGTISADGGAGANFNCTIGSPENQGSAGGAVLLQALSLQLAGTISATGGDGGVGTGAGGGPGGQITLHIDPPFPPPSGWFNVSGGQPDRSDRYVPSQGNDGTPAPTATPGPAGANGQVHVAALTPAERAALPPPPPPLLAPLGAAPALLPPLPAATFGKDMACGTSDDLDVGAGRVLRLHGTQRYGHICVHDGGEIKADPALTLVAGTILVGPGARIDADGVITGTVHPATSSAPTWPRAVPPAGAQGAPGADSGTLNEDDTPVAGPPGGAGGGSLALIASRVLIAGTVSADGGAGGDGGQGGMCGFRTLNYDSTGGAGGGSGGGLLIVAGALQLTGRLSVLGGAVGHPGRDARCGPISGQPGRAGRISLLVDTLYAPAAPDLPVAGPGYLGHTLPVDPVPSPAAPGARYFPATDHTLAGPFLAYWGAHGGGAAFGSPLTEPFGEQGRTLQYTERALLVLAGGRVDQAPLGRILTAGRRFAPVPAVPSTATLRYFPATGHTLSGRFLAYWQAHDGAHTLGAPISEVVTEGNGDGTGRRYPLQWFERGRLEYHAENAGTPYDLLLGRLGAQALQQRGWLPPS